MFAGGTAKQTRLTAGMDHVLGSAFDDQAHHQPFTAHFDHLCILVHERLQSFAEELAGFLGTPQEAFLIDHIQRGQGRSTGQRIAAERAAMGTRGEHIRQLRRGDQHAHGHAARHGLGQRARPA